MNRSSTRIGDLSALLSPTMAIAPSGLDMVRAHLSFYHAGRVAEGATARRVSASSPVGTSGTAVIPIECVHFDCSQQLAAEGVRPTIIASTPHKAELSPLSPLSPEALAYEQGRINSLHNDFVVALARGRGVDAASVKRDFGNGRVLNAREARRVGMVDSIAPNLPDALSRMLPASRRSSSAVSSSGSSRAQMQREIDVLKLS